MNIYIGNLAFNITEESLRSMFEAFGEIESAKVITDRFTGRSKGFGFVEMPSNSEADQAIKALNGKFIEGRNIKVNQANPGGKKSRRSSNRRKYY
jgi:RNA recognition motif-containing protein